jgi:hypothetical protein
MNGLKQRFDALCGKVIAAPDGSEELQSALAELRNALADHAQHLRTQAADLRQKDVPLFDDEGEG